MTYDGATETNPLYITALYISAPFLHGSLTPAANGLRAHPSTARDGNRLVRSRHDLSRDKRSTEIANTPVSVARNGVAAPHVVRADECNR